MKLKKTWVLIEHAGGSKEWMEQSKADYAWQTGQIPGAKCIELVEAYNKPKKGK